MGDLSLTLPSGLPHGSTFIIITHVRNEIRYLWEDVSRRESGLVATQLIVAFYQIMENKLVKIKYMYSITKYCNVTKYKGHLKMCGAKCYTVTISLLLLAC